MKVTNLEAYQVQVHEVSDGLFSILRTDTHPDDVTPIVVDQDKFVTLHNVEIAPGGYIYLVARLEAGLAELEIMVGQSQVHVHSIWPGGGQLTEDVAEKMSKNWAGISYDIEL